MTAPAQNPDAPVKNGTFHGISAGRKIKNNLATMVFIACFVIAVIPLAALSYTVISKGYKAIIEPDWWQFSQFGVAAESTAGGAYHAIMGSLLQAGVATLISVPLGMLCAVYLVEYAGNSRLGRVTTFMVDILSGIPSIVAALFVLMVWITTLGFDKSGLAVSFALVLLMLPVVVRSTEEMLKLVPDELREASFALGVPKWKTILRIVIPTALSGMISGIFLAIARIMGETAPVLILVGYAASINTNMFEGEMASLPLLIFNERNNASVGGDHRIWGASLTLIMLIALFSFLASAASKLLAPKTK